MENKNLRKGYTTGSCSAAGTAAALMGIFADEKIKKWILSGPTGLDILVPITSVEKLDKYSATAIVTKDGGDDPDITTGAKIFITCRLVNKIDELNENDNKGYFLSNRIYLKAGKGIGIVTKPGLACPEGKAAINPVPRKMILGEAEKLLEKYDYEGGLIIEISIPKGVELAEKTFNPKLGIVGGISILGTSGQVNPMSSQAILDTIKVELSVAKAMSNRELNEKNSIVLTPGNYGYDFFRNYSEDRIIKVSNFIGQGVVMAAEAGFSEIIISGHLGKIIKVAGGMMDTHSKNGDNRVATAVEVWNSLQSRLMLAEKNRDKVATAISECVMVDEILRVVLDAVGQEGLQEFSREIGRKTLFNLKKNLVKVNPKYDKIIINLVMFTNKFGLLYKGGTTEI